MRPIFPLCLALAAATITLSVGCGGGVSGSSSKGEAPMGLTYGPGSTTYIQGVTITPNKAYCNGGAVTGYTVSPSLPSGLSLDAQSGAISGTPTAVSPQTTYTVVASNAAGSTSCTLALSVAAWNGTGVQTGAMLQVRNRHTSTLLANGKVLVVGGTRNADQGPKAELFDPATGTWSPAGNPASRFGHTATLLADGRVLVVGGTDTSTGAWLELKSAEIYDPASNTWTSAGNMSTGRSDHGAALMSNGKVLVVGGQLGTTPAPSEAEIFDPATGTWSLAAPNSALSGINRLIALSSGRVLSIGSGGCSVYDPTTNTWTATGPAGPMSSDHTATLLSNGKVLVAGVYLSGSTPYGGCQLYDPATNAWKATTSMGTLRLAHAALTLADGRVLLLGGTQGWEKMPLVSAEVFDPATETWAEFGKLGVGRTLPAATLLPSGKVLVCGGSDRPNGGEWVNTAELM